MRTRWPAWAGAVTALALAVAPARASGLDPVRGHLSIGYTRLFAPDAPSGSLSVGAGVDLPVTRNLRAGVAIGYHLLGGNTVQRGSLFANVDYSEFDAELLASWLPQRLGPIGRIAAGPALVSARSVLSSSGTGAGFADLAIEELAPGVALDVTLMRRSEAPVRVGLELGTRIAYLKHATWTLATTRLTFHY
jgi:hypothetical protein